MPDAGPRERATIRPPATNAKKPATSARVRSSRPHAVITASAPRPLSVEKPVPYATPTIIAPTRKIGAVM